MPRKPKAKPPAAPPGAYAEWKKQVAALLERKGISAGVMREKAWRNLFNCRHRIRGGRRSGGG